MNFKFTFVTFIVVGAIILISSCTNKNNIKPDFPVYSYATTIVNPPSHFQVNYIVSSPGDRIASITFDTNSVWTVTKLGDARILYNISNGVDKLGITSTDTIGFQGGKVYLFTANNFSSISVSNFLVNFNKLPDDYATFPKNF